MQSIFAIIACVKGSKPQDIRSHDQSPPGLPQFLGYATATTGDHRPMSAPLLHIESSPSLPREADVVVIGGGVVGVFTSYYLARRGLKVALLEKGRVAAEQSSRNWGWCRQQNRDARELPLATKSLDLWERVAQETGEDTGFRRCGLLYLSNDENELAGWAKWRDFARTVGVTTHMLNAEEANARGKMTGRKWKGGVFSPTDGTADTSKAVPIAARAIMAAGGTVHQHCAARGVELCRPGQRGGDRSRHDPDENGGHGRRRVGVFILQPAWYSLSAGIRALFHSRPGSRRSRAA
jgi:hypothetical protein